MNSDLPGGLHPDELGFTEPGMEQLLRALTADGTASELAGEQAALAMFRAHVPAPAGAPPFAAAVPGAAVPGAVPGPAVPGALEAPTRVQPAANGGVIPPKRPVRAPRLRGGFPRLRIAIVTATAMVGGFAAAAYAAALPAPVQHIAYQAFHVFGVPDSGHQHGSRTSGGPSGIPRSITPGGAHRGSPSKQPHPTPSGSGGHSASSPAVPPSATPSSSASAGSPSGPPTGPAVLSAVAASSDIPAGTSATINGMLTLGSSPGSGTYVRLMEHVVGIPGWLLVKRAQTSAQGDVSFATPVLRRNAWFRLADASGAKSTVVEITVLPSVSATLRPGPKGIKDYITVTTTYARKGDVVVLQLLQNGTWVTVKQGVLAANGKVVIAISATKRQGQELQAVLLPTPRHGQATSPPVTVPPPA